MTNKQMTAEIKRTAKAYRRDHKLYSPKGTVLIDINHSLPTVFIELPFDRAGGFFFQGENAGDVIEEATTVSNKFNVSLEDAMLWMSSSWV